MMQEVAKANREQISRKDEAKLQEKEEEQRILEYIRQRDAREQVATDSLSADMDNM